MSDLLLIIIAVELAIVILAWPEARKTAYAVGWLTTVGAIILALVYLLGQLPGIIPAWLDPTMVLQYAILIIGFCAGFVLCSDAARGWVGERRITWGPPDQDRMPLFGVLAILAIMVLIYSSLLLAGALERTSLLHREGRLIWGVGGAIGDLLVLGWVVLGLRRLKRSGCEFHTLKIMRTARSIMNPSRS